MARITNAQLAAEIVDIKLVISQLAALVSQQMATQPVATQPVATQPVATQPVATQPVAKPKPPVFPHSVEFPDFDTMQSAIIPGYCPCLRYTNNRPYIAGETEFAVRQCGRIRKDSTPCESHKPPKRTRNEREFYTYRKELHDKWIIKFGIGKGGK